LDVCEDIFGLSKGDLCAQAEDSCGEGVLGGEAAGVEIDGLLVLSMWITQSGNV
jgi:hypothetical protein